MFDSISNLVYWVLAIVLSTGFGFGISFLICANILTKSNNYGDSVGDSSEYSGGVTFTRRVNRINRSERESFLNTMCPDLNKGIRQPKWDEEVRRLTKEELEYYDKPMSEAELNNINNTFEEVESDFEAWEKENNGSDFNPFKPL